MARLQQSAVDIVQVQQIVNALLALGGFRAAGVGQNRRHLGVGEAGVAEHHGRIELVGADVAVLGHQHVADHAQALHVRVQRAQAVGQLLRQHRNHASREVNAGGAVVGVDVNGRAGFHVGTDVGNRDQQAPALEGGFATAEFGRLAVDGIVKIARVFAVDGDQGHVGQVDAVFLVLRPHLVRQGPRLRHAFGAEFMRHAIFAHGNFDFHAGVVNLAQHFLDSAHRLAVERRRLGQFDNDHLARLAQAGCALGNQYVLAIALVFGRQQPDAAFLQQTTDDGMDRTLDDLHHAPFGPALAIRAHNAHLDAILVHRGAHFIGRQVDVRLAIVPNHIAVAVTVTLDGPVDFIQHSAGNVIVFDTKTSFVFGIAAAPQM